MSNASQTKARRQQAIAEGGAILARAYRDLDERTPHEAARAAWVPGGPGVAELERRIRERRGLLAA